MLFGSRIRAVRKAAHVTRERAAERAHITASYLGEVERGEKWPALEIICAIAVALDVSPATFFEFESEETDPTVLRRHLQRILEDSVLPQQQQALRVLKALIKQ
jgi:transcriptional regulator with XRE-family HTH domain